MGQELGITKEKLGLFLTLHGVLYGVSKFANGFLADRSNGPRVHGRVARHLGAAQRFFWLQFRCAGVSVYLWNGERLFKAWLSTVRAAHRQTGFAQTARDQILHLEFLAQHRQHPHRPPLRDFSSAEVCSHPTGGFGFFVPAGIAIVIAVVLWRMCPTRRRRLACPEFGARIWTCRKKIRTKTSTRLCGDRSSPTNSSGCSRRQISSFLHDPLRRIRLGRDVADRGQTHPNHESRMDGRRFRSVRLLARCLRLDHRSLSRGRAVRACVVYDGTRGRLGLCFLEIETQSELLITGLLSTGNFCVRPAMSARHRLRNFRHQNAPPPLPSA